jgi:hypothetical protein
MRLTALFLIGWILTALGDLTEREWPKTFAIGGRTVKFSSALTAAGVVFFLIALFSGKNE